MQIHVLVALTVSGSLQVSRTAALDLHTALGFLLDMLDISTAVPNNLSTQVEAGDRLQANGDLLLGPFALRNISQWNLMSGHTYTTVFISLDLLLVTTTKTALVDQCREFLFHEFLNLGHSLLEARL